MEVQFQVLGPSGREGEILQTSNGPLQYVRGRPCVRVPWRGPELNEPYPLRIPLSARTVAEIFVHT